jgi:hypothetical protein
MRIAKIAGVAEREIVRKLFSNIQKYSGMPHSFVIECYLQAKLWGLMFSVKYILYTKLKPSLLLAKVIINCWS